LQYKYFVCGFLKILLGLSSLVFFGSFFVACLIFVFNIFNFASYKYFLWGVVFPFLGLLIFFELGLGSCLYKFYRSNKANVFLYVLESDFLQNQFQNFFSLYQGSFSHTNNSFYFANLIYPVTLYVESDSCYLNLEGRYRVVNRVVSPFRILRSGFEVLRCLIELSLIYVK
jgi:hypothetical protein